jgi:hypothetical protein
MFRVKEGKIVEASPGELVPEGDAVHPVAWRDGVPTHFMDKKKEGREILRQWHDRVEEPEHYVVGEKVRKFETGATRDTDTDKYTYAAFFSPEVLERRAAYMHKHRHQADGSLRPGDNWQKGIPKDAYVDSLLRHVVDVWKEHKGLPAPDGMEEAICAAMFNLEGLLYEILKDKKRAESEAVGSNVADKIFREATEKGFFKTKTPAE